MKHLLLTTIAAVLVVGCGTSIHDAASDRNIEAVKQHLAAGADVNAKTDVWRHTPLHFAARNGRKGKAELLIAEGADVNAQRGDGETPLDDAILFKQTKSPTSSANTAARRGKN